MRILVTTSTFPVSLDDGIPRFIYDLAESLTERADVTVLAPGTPTTPPQGRLGSLDVRRFNYFQPRTLQRLTPSGGQGMIDKARGSWLARAQILPFLWRQARETGRLARSLDVDVVNAHWLVPQGLTAAWALGKRRKAKLVLHIHAADVYLLRRVPFGRAIARFVVERTDAIFSAGSHVRDKLDELLGYPSGAQLQPMGVHAELFTATQAESKPLANRPAFRDGYLLFVGRFVEKKGTTFLLQALPRLLQQYPGLGLVLVGSGPDETALRNEVTKLGLNQAVFFAGRKSHDELVSLLSTCRVAVVPSIIDSKGETEGMPTVIMEAMSTGVRVVASSVDGIPDIIRHEENGWLCREKDPADLAEKILVALSDPSPSQVTRAAMETSKRFGWPQVAANYFRCIDQLTCSAGESAR